MTKKIICPITKSPSKNNTGRIGPINKQDWYQGIEVAIEIHKKTPNSQIAIITNFKPNTDEHEADIYLEILNRRGINNIIIIREGLETIGQIEAAKKLAKKSEADLVLVSTSLHFLRVKYYAGSGVLHKISWGIPRPLEVPRDIILIFLAPLIDVFGIRGIYKDILIKRRGKGLL